MTTTANPEQAEAWNGENGHRWVTTADVRDRVLAPVADALLAAADPGPGARVLDIGCGCGATTLMAAGRVGETGSALGIDLSEPMLDVARRRTDAAGARNTSLVHADAQTHEFEPASADLVISRFGTMFFSDPGAAFVNIATALRPGGRLCVATWQPLAANEWLTVPGAALLQHTGQSAPGTDGPGMFAQSDPAVVRGTLGAAGFSDVRVIATEVTFTVGESLDTAVAYLADSGPGRALLETIPEGHARAAALAGVRAALVGHHDGGGVRLGGGVWLITAVR